MTSWASIALRAGLLLVGLAKDEEDAASPISTEDLLFVPTLKASAADLYSRLLALAAEWCRRRAGISDKFHIQAASKAAPWLISPGMTLSKVSVWLWWASR